MSKTNKLTILEDILFILIFIHLKINLIEADFVDIYSKAKICSFESKTNCDLELEPDLNLLLKESRDYLELKHVWVEWRNATGKKMRPKYLRFVDLMNENARVNGLY